MMAMMAMMAVLMDMRAEEIVLRNVRDVDENGTVLWTESKSEAGTRRLVIPPQLQRCIAKLVHGRASSEPLFYSSRAKAGYFDRALPRKWSNKISRAAGVLEVGAHGLRRTFATLGTAIGQTPEALALALGHESTRTTTESYIDPDVKAEADQRRTLFAIQGGKR